MEDIISRIKYKIDADTERRVELIDRISAIQSEVMYLDGIIDGMKGAILVIESDGE